MPAGQFLLYHSYAELVADGTIDLDTHTFSAVLLDSGYTPSLAHDEYADISADELATANGYTAGGQVLTGVTWAQVSGVATFNSTPPEWTPSVGAIVARYLAIKDDTATNDKLVGYMPLDGTGIDVSRSSPNTFKVNPGAQGWFTHKVNP